MCDEPTGALDYKTSREILKLIEDVNKMYATTVILVTHNDALRRMADQVLRLRDGRIMENTRNAAKLRSLRIWSGNCRRRCVTITDAEALRR